MQPTPAMLLGPAASAPPTPRARALKRQRDGARAQPRSGSSDGSNPAATDDAGRPEGRPAPFGHAKAGLFYGFRGEALASLADVALVTISTRTRPHLPAHRLTIGPGGLRTLSVLAAGDTDAPLSHGTHVAVREFFAGLPVRRQQLVYCPASAPSIRVGV